MSATQLDATPSTVSRETPSAAPGPADEQTASPDSAVDDMLRLETLAKCLSRWLT